VLAFACGRRDVGGGSKRRVAGGRRFGRISQNATYGFRPAKAIVP
jgi:hypothetical protein